MTKRPAQPTLQGTLADLRQASVAQLAALDQVIAAAKEPAAAAGPSGDDEPDKPKWISVDKVVVEYGISRNTLYTSVLSQVTTRKMGRRLLGSRASMDKFFEGLPSLPSVGRRHPRGSAPKNRKAA